VPSWDPGRRFVPEAQALFKMVFDQPLDRDSRNGLVPGLVEAWELAEDGLSLAVQLREGVVFHDGAPMESADFRWSFLERFREEGAFDAAWVWRRVVDIETPSATRAVMRFARPSPGAVAWLAFLGSFVVKRGTLAGAGALAARPLGTGPYRVVEHRPGERIELERHEEYWGPKPPLRRVTIEIIAEASARVAAVQAGRVDLAVAVPVRDVPRLDSRDGLEGEVSPVTRIILLRLPDMGGFADRAVRLAAHHAIDKAALSRAFFNEVPATLSLPALPGAPGDVARFTVPHDPNIAFQLLEDAGHGSENPAQVRLAASRGGFPGDAEMARAIVGMWRTVGIEAELEVMAPGRLALLGRAGRLPEAVLGVFDCAVDDPEVCAGALMHPLLPVPPWQEVGLAGRVEALMDEPDAVSRLAGWQELNRAVVEEGLCVPLLQGVQTVVRRSALSYRAYGSGWVLPQTMGWIA
jgi:peptide/nickel transport system substrate-binding protein